MKKLRCIFILALIVITIVIGVKIINKNETKETSFMVENAETIVQEEIRTVKISAVGDCTIGWDPRYGYETRYDKYLDDNNGDYGYYFAKVKDVFE